MGDECTIQNYTEISWALQAEWKNILHDGRNHVNLTADYKVIYQIHFAFIGLLVFVPVLV